MLKNKLVVLAAITFALLFVVSGCDSTPENITGSALSTVSTDVLTKALESSTETTVVSTSTIPRGKTVRFEWSSLSLDITNVKHVGTKTATNDMGEPFEEPIYTVYPG